MNYGVRIKFSDNTIYQNAFVSEERFVLRWSATILNTSKLLSTGFFYPGFISTLPDDKKAMHVDIFNNRLENGWHGARRAHRRSSVTALKQDSLAAL